MFVSRVKVKMCNAAHVWLMCHSGPAGLQTAALDGGVALIDLHSEGRSARGDLHESLSTNSLLIKHRRQEVMNETDVYMLHLTLP